LAEVALESRIKVNSYLLIAFDYNNSPKRRQQEIRT